MTLAIGDPAPDFTLPADGGGTVGVAGHAAAVLEAAPGA